MHPCRPRQRTGIVWTCHRHPASLGCSTPKFPVTPRHPPSGRIRALLSALLLGAAGTLAPARQSPFYQFTPIAHEGMATPAGETLESIEGKVSVNERGAVAFIADVDGANQLFVGSIENAPVNLSRSPSARNFDFPQVNNHGRVVTRELAGGNSVVRVWNQAAPGSYDIVATTSTTGFGQLTLPVIGNTTDPTDPPQVGFLGRIGDLPFEYWVNNTGFANQQERVSSLLGGTLASFRPASAESGARVIAAQLQGVSGDYDFKRLFAFSDPDDIGLWIPTLIAREEEGWGADDWIQLGDTPGISDSGEVIAFAGKKIDGTTGIHIAISESRFAGAPEIIRVVDLDTIIGCTADGQPIRFDEFDFEGRIAVLHQKLGAPGIEDDKVILAFVARPDRGSVANPLLAGAPLYFSANRGLWTIDLEIREALDAPGVLNPYICTPLPVVQEGDSIDGSIIDSVVLWDPLAFPTNKPPVGAPHFTAPGDHFVAFASETSSGVRVFRAGRLDTDSDGLPDHWEEPGGGIDIDGDGTVDLDLPRLGANPWRRDLFLEIDWQSPRVTGAATPWSNAPAPRITHRLARMFAEAPVPNPDGSTGITLHVDAGPDDDDTGMPHSVNMGRFTDHLLDGGETIHAAGDPDGHFDIIHVGRPASLKVAGVSISSFQELKDEHFGHRDRRARELAFRYCILGDFQEFVTLGDNVTPWASRVAGATDTTITAINPLPAIPALSALKIVSGTGAGQVRKPLALNGNTLTVEAWDVVPDATSWFLILDGSTLGIGETNFMPEPANHGFPGNDFLLSLAGKGVNNRGRLSTAIDQWQTIAHEMGHTLCLLHGGTNFETDRVDYRSLMSYYYMDRPHLGVDSYSDSTSPVRDDWGTIGYGIPCGGWSLGITLFKNDDGEVPNRPDIDITGYPTPPPIDPPADPYPEGDPAPPDPPPIPPDLEAPTVVILTPAEGDTLGSSQTVVAHAEDNDAIEEIVLYLDTDGDGEWNPVGEAFGGPPNGAGNFAADFSGIAGPLGMRKVLAAARDPSDNWGAQEISVLTGSGAGAGSFLSQTSGSFPAQGAGLDRQASSIGPIAVPGSGAMSFTLSATPAVRLPGGGGHREDARVTRITFDGVEIPLDSICNAAGSDPSICSAYWNAPDAGELFVEISGPLVADGLGTNEAHPAQGWELAVTHEAIDFTPPQASITEPSGDGFVGVGQPLLVTVAAGDDYAVDMVRVEFDIDGDGDTAGAGESQLATPAGGDLHSATFPNVQGPGGQRPILAIVTDSSGLETSVVGSVEVREPDLTAPMVAIQSPPAGWPIEDGMDLELEILASDDVAVASVMVAFDVDGDGSQESVEAVLDSDHLYRAAFAGVTGPNGPRDVDVVATDSSGNAAPASLPVTIGGIEPVTELIFSDPEGHIDAQPSVWSGGSQQTIAYDPLEVPGSGTLTFRVTATPNVRQEVQNISRSDPYVRWIEFGGSTIDLRSSLECNPYGSDPAICETSIELDGGGMLDFELLGPGTWNIWGGFSGHAAQDYVLEVEFTAVDITPPTVGLTSPTLGADLALGSPLTVDLTVSDSREVASVVVLFDVNGDGDTSDFGEQVSAADLGGDAYRASFAALSGGPWRRTIEVLATDSSFNTTRRSYGVGVGGVGGGELLLFADSGVIPAQPIDINGGSRQVIPVAPIAIPGQGRVTIRVTASPSIRSLGTNLERHDPMVVQVDFNGSLVDLDPDCSPWDAEPNVCSSVWDTPGPGTLGFDILGGGTWNIWGEFSGHAEQDYDVEVLFQPGPVVDTVVPAAGPVGGGQPVTITGEGFGFDAVVLFDEVAASQVQRVSSTELTCVTPPGTPGTATVKVLNPDSDNQPWNYGRPYGLFGTLAGGFLYEAQPAPAPLQAERLLTTLNGFFPAQPSEDSGGFRQSATAGLTIPGAGRLRFETHAFVSLHDAIPGPFDDPGDLEYHNTSSTVTGFHGGNAANYLPSTDFTALDFTYGPVIGNATRVVPATAAGAGDFTVAGPAKWNAFWRSFGDFVLSSAPAQSWSTAVWFADQPALTGITPETGPSGAETAVTLSGSHFAEGLEVRIGGQLAGNLTVVDATTATCTTPPGATGPADVSVSLLGMTATLADGFEFRQDDPYLAWAEPFFSPADLQDPAKEASLWGVDADPDQDGIVNAVVRTYRGNPLLPNSAALPGIRRDGDDIFLELVLDESMSDLVVIVETSTNGSAWTPGATFRLLGEGLGYTREAGTFTSFREDSESGGIWTIRESIDRSAPARMVRTRIIEAAGP